MSTLTGLDYLLEHASFADKEAREKTEARINALLDAACEISRAGWRDVEDAQSDVITVIDAINGDHSARVSLGMEKGE